jgi:hypothetical protein
MLHVSRWAIVVLGSVEIVLLKFRIVLVPQQLLVAGRPTWVFTIVLQHRESLTQQA